VLFSSFEMMQSLRAGYDTLKYWGKTRSVAADHAHSIARVLHQRSDLDVLLTLVERDGVAIVTGYWSENKCAQARAEIDRLLAGYPDIVRASSGGSDKRMYGVESVSPLLAEFHGDSFLRGFGELVGGLELYNFATLAARIDATPENNGSGDGWHRDAHGYQFKSILYLSDVSEENGPFEYLPGSHMPWRAALDTVLGGLPPPPNSRYEPVMIDRIVRRFGTRVRHYPARPGTLLLVNTAGMHRGRPLDSGTRYALTNYYYHPFQVDKGRIASFPPLMPGTAERICSDLHLT
jgi:hypothetical protein